MRSCAAFHKFVAAGYSHRKFYLVRRATKDPPEHFFMSEQQSHSTRSIVIAIVAAVVFALLLPNLMLLAGVPREELAETASTWLTPLQLGGDIFLNLLKMVVVPLVMASVMTGVIGMGDIRRLGRPGLCTLAYYFVTTALAVVLGLIVVSAVRPGERVESSERERLSAAVAGNADAEDGGKTAEDAQPDSVGDILQNLVMMLFTDNLFRSAVEANLLPLIVFSIVFAGLLTTMGERAAALMELIKQGNDALMALILLIMRVAPLGIFCLVAARFGKENAEGQFFAELAKTGYYSLSVLAGLAIHSTVTLPLILWLTTGRNPYRFVLQISEALLTAFSTSSSSATLPVTMEKTIDKAGVSRKSVDFVLPLGATVNMDGTALYEAVAAIYIAQVLGVDMTFGQQVIVAVTATLAAIGAAGIPQAGLVTMVIVLSAVGLPAKGMELILSVDWLLDRFRTTVNVFGDACGAAVVERTFPDDGGST